MLMQDNSLFIPVEQPNMKPQRTKNARLPMEQRLNSFEAVEKTYTEEEALLEASRCLKCPTHWCQKACPAGVPVTDFIAKVRAKDYEGAYALIRTASALPEICSRICPQEKQCQSNCTRGIRTQAVGIGRLERFVVERHYAANVPEKAAAPRKKRVAVVGSGPSGLAAARSLAESGYEVTVFEKSDRPGGLLEYGIPAMKLDKGVVDRLLAALARQGVTFRTGVCVGRDISAQSLKEDYDAVILAVGAGNARRLGPVEESNASGIYYAVDYLTASTKAVLEGGMPDLAKDKNVVIVGGGDTGNDCVGTAIRQGCKSLIQVEMLPQRTGRQIIWNPYPQRQPETKFDSSQEEALNRFCRDPHLYQTSVKAVQEQDGQLVSVTLISLEPVQQNGRLVMRELPGTETIVPCELLIVAAGFLGPDADVAQAFSLETDARSNLAARDYAASSDNVFVCGDCRTGQSLAVKAMKDGLRCADAVRRALSGAE